MQKIATTKITMFTLLMLGIIAVAVLGFQANAFATHSGVYFYEEVFIGNFPSHVDESVVTSYSDPCPYPACM